MLSRAHFGDGITTSDSEREAKTTVYFLVYNIHPLSKWQGGGALGLLSMDVLSWVISFSMNKSGSSHDNEHY